MSLKYRGVSYSQSEFGLELQGELRVCILRYRGVPYLLARFAKD